MESQEPSIRNRISEDVARSELQAMERDPLHALLNQDQKFKIVVGEYQRHARDVVNQFVKESSDKSEVTMMQAFRSIQNRYEGRMEEHERRVAQVIGSEARDALCGQRSHMLHEHQVHFEAGEKCLVKPDALGATVTHCKLSEILT